MTFKDLKVGYQVYILNRGTELKVLTGKVTAISAPHLPQPTTSINTMQMVVDVTIEHDGLSRIYTIQENLSVTYAGQDLVLSTERDGIVKELEAMKVQSEDAISKIDKHKQTIADCSRILSELNPAFKEKKETEERFCKLESSIGDLKTMISSLVKDMRNENERKPNARTA